MKLCICLAFASLSPAIDETPETEGAVDSVRNLLVAESRSSDIAKDRVSALRGLRTEDTSNAAWWHSGFLNVNGEWKSYDDAVTELAANRNASEYVRRREHAKTASDHWRLAKWCKANRMEDRHRLHAIQAIQAVRLDPDFVQLHSQGDLGLVQCFGMWVQPEVAAQLRQEKEYQRRCFKQWSPLCQRIARKLGGNTAAVREGERLLSEINSPDAVPVIDFVVGRSGPGGIRYAINALSRIDSVRSSRILAKYAVFSPIKSVRHAAINVLADRRLAHFVPQLLDILATEVTEDKTPVHAQSNRGFWSMPDYVFQQTFK
jgi:hypothetical protein